MASSQRPPSESAPLVPNTSDTSLFSRFFGSNSGRSAAGQSPVASGERSEYGALDSPGHGSKIEKWSVVPSPKPRVQKVAKGDTDLEWDDEEVNQLVHEQKKLAYLQKQGEALLVPDEAPEDGFGLSLPQDELKQMQGTEKKRDEEFDEFEFLDEKEIQAVEHNDPFLNRLCQEDFKEINGLFFSHEEYKKKSWFIIQLNEKLLIPAQNFENEHPYIYLVAKEGSLYLLATFCSAPPVLFSLGALTNRSAKDVLKDPLFFLHTHPVIGVLSVYCAVSSARANLPMLRKNFSTALEGLRDVILGIPEHPIRNPLIIAGAIFSGSAQGILGFQSFESFNRNLAIANFIATFLANGTIRTMGLSNAMKRWDKWRSLPWDEQKKDITWYNIALTLIPAVIAAVPFGQKIIDALGFLSNGRIKNLDQVWLLLIGPTLSLANSITFGGQILQFPETLSGTATGIQQSSNNFIKVLNGLDLVLLLGSGVSGYNVLRDVLENANIYGDRIDPIAAKFLEVLFAVSVTLLNINIVLRGRFFPLKAVEHKKAEGEPVPVPRRTLTKSESTIVRGRSFSVNRNDPEPVVSSLGEARRADWEKTQLYGFFSLGGFVTKSEKPVIREGYIQRTPMGDREE